MQNIELITLPTRKDDRGWVITPPVIKNFGSAHLHIPSLKPKAVRGNHYHETHSEAVIILGGECLVATRNIFTDTCEEFVYDGIIKQLLLIPPNITHAFKNIDYHSIYLVCYCYCSDGEGDKAGVSISSTADKILT
jgi:dTDP-4-dehydrorhamnose 3,5-epimerase-like enzyme